MALLLPEAAAAAAAEQAQQLLLAGLGVVEAAEAAAPAAGPLSEYCGLLAVDFEALRFGELLGAGAFGEVSAAECPALGCGRVAVKMMTGAADDRQLRLLLSEADSMARVAGHPNVLAFIALVLRDGRPAGLVTELAPYGSLGDLVKRGVRPSAADALLLSRQLCAGLAHVHASGVFHQDIKPDNVLLCQGADGAVVAKLADFGMAQRADKPLEHCGGTPFYQSPEMVAGVVSEKSDVWALALTCAEMAMGARPMVCADGWGQDEMRRVARQGTHIAVPAWFRREWRALSEALLVADPAQRPDAYGMAALVEEQLARVLAQEQLAAVPEAFALGALF